MKVLCVNNIIDSGSGGGTATRTKQLSKFLAYKSHSIELLSLNLGNLDDSSDMLKEVKVTLLKTINKRFYIPALNEFGKIESAVIKADIVHLMNHWTFINVVTGYYARKHSVPYVICPAGALRIFGRSKIIKKAFNLFFGNHLLRKANAIISINNDEEVEFKKSICHRDQILTVIPNGIDENDYKLVCSNSSVKLPGENFILFLGRLNEIKGPDILFDAFASISVDFPKLNLVFAGPDEGLRSSIEKKSLELGLSDRVHFTGFLAQRAKVEVLSKCCMLVIPSRKEAMSIVVLEGAMMKKPIVFTDECGVDDFVLNGIGRTVSVSSKAIEFEMSYLLNSEENAKEIGRNAYDFTVKNYSWMTTVNEHIELFQKVLINNNS